MFVLLKYKTPIAAMSRPPSRIRESCPQILGRAILHSAEGRCGRGKTRIESSTGSACVQAYSTGVRVCAWPRTSS